MSTVRERVGKIERAMGTQGDAAYCRCPETVWDFRWGAPIVSVNADGTLELGPEEEPAGAEVCERCGLPVQVIKLTWGDPVMEADG